MAGEHSYKFTWDCGGKEVFLCGSFNNWEKTPMAKSRSQAGVFTKTLALPEGRYEYKFQVDGEWVLDTAKERCANDQGFINNVCWIPEQVSGAHGLSQDSTQSGPVSLILPTASFPSAEYVTSHMEDSESDSSDDTSDTTSVSSSTSSVDLTGQPFAKLSVKSYNAPPQLLKSKLGEHVQSHGLSAHVTSMQWKDSLSGKGKGYSIVHVSPPQLAEDVILRLNGSLLLGKFKLNVKRYKREGRARRRAPKKDKAAKDKTTKVYVGSLPKFANQGHLKEHFSSFKEKIVKIELARDKESHKSKGFGFVFFSNLTSAKAAVQKLNGSQLLGKHTIKVSLAKEDKPPSSSPGLSLQTAAGDSDSESVSSIASSSGELCQVFVNSNPPLPDKISNKQIADHFSSYKGRFTQAKVVRDKQRKSKGYGIVTFASRDLAEEAVIVYNGSKLLGAYQLSLHCKQAERPDLASPIKATDTRRVSSSSGGHPSMLSEFTPEPANTKQQYTVKLTCLPPAQRLDREGLAGILRHYGELPKLPKIFEGKNRYALANFTTLAGAQNAITSLNMTSLQGSTIKVSLKDGQSSEPSTPLTTEPLNAAANIHQSTVQAPPLASQWVVRLDNVDHLVSMEELKTMVHVPVEKVERINSPPTSVLLHFSTYEHSQVVVQQINGKVLLGNTIQAYIVPTSQSSQVGSITPPAVPRGILPHPGAPVQPMMAYPAPIHSLQPLHPQSMAPPSGPRSIPPHPGVPPPTHTSHPPLLSTQPLTPAPLGSGDKTLKLSPGDWSRLMTVGPSGKILFQDVIEPYKTNPSIKINTDVTNLSVHFTGHPEAVDSAYRRVCAEVFRELPIPDGFQKASLVHLRPDLPSAIQQKYGVTLTGYDDSNTTVRLDGDSSHFSAAREELEKALRHVRKSEIAFNLTPPLLASVRERFRIESIQTCVFAHDNLVTVYSLSQQTNKKALQILQQGPFVESISNISSEAYDKVLPSVQNPQIEITRQGSNVMVRSYLQHEVQAVASSLRQKVEMASVQQSVFDGGPEEIAYLIHLSKIDHQAKEIMSSLPAQCVFKKNSIALKGSTQAVQETQTAIRVRLLSRVSIRRFVFQANLKFISQLEAFILKPVSKEVHWFKQDQQQVPVSRQRSQTRRRTSSEGDEGESGLVVYSESPVTFQSVCSNLENVSPSNKRLTLRKGAAHSIKLSDPHVKSKLEMKYRVRIINREGLDSVMIHGLTAKEAHDCGAEIEDRVESSHEISKHIPISHDQEVYLKKNCEQELKELKEECSELHFLKPRNEGETISLRIKSTVKKVESVHERLSEILASLITKTFVLNYESKFYQMWKRRWDQVKKDQERSSDILVYFEKKSSAEKNEATCIYIVGTDQEEIDRIGDLISQKATQTKTISLTPASSIALRKDKKEFLWPLAVHLEIKSNNAILTAPIECEQDLETAEEEIQKFLGEKTTIVKNLTSSDEVVGLVLTSRSKAATYLTVANSIVSAHGVKVTALRKPQIGLHLRGTLAAIQTVEPLLKMKVLKPIEQGIGKITISVKAMYKSVLSSGSFKQFTSKLQDDYCVVCVLPRTVKANKVVRKAMIQPSSSARCLKLELCQGSLVNEETDAIVNAANEDLQHIGGLAKAIVDAGGPTIQSECDEYIQGHTKLRAGQVTLLGPGNLPCKAIIHAVGPRWQGGVKGEESNLYLTVYRSLEAASVAQYGSIALPAISTGIFGVPGSICAKASLKAVRDFCQTFPGSSLHTVRFVLFMQQELNDFCSYFDTDPILNSSSGSAAEAVPTFTVSSTSSSSESGAWLWTNDQGSYSPYSPDVAQQLSAACSQNPRGSYQFTVNRTMYSVNFSTMIQTNVQTGHQRRVKFDPTSTPAASGGVQWYYRDDSRGFSPYTQADSQSIERMYQTQTPNHLQIGGKLYTFDFTSMCQINILTKYKRPLQRRIESSTDQSPPPVLKKPTAKSSPPKDMHVVLRGPQDSLEAARTKFERKLTGYLKKESITVPFTVSDDFSIKIQRTASKHHTTCTIISVPTQGAQKPQSVIKLEGIDSEVQSTVKSIQQLIIDFQVSNTADSELDVPPPPEWQTQTATTTVFNVARGTAEWTRVESKFTATCTSQVVSITRIQNKWLWQNYCIHKKRLHMKNDGVVNEMELFHGTRANEPKVIYEGENGFDMRYSNQGMWGQANYFAVNASYSVGYSYSTPDGCKEMFLVKVLTGDSYRCASNSRLRKPPEKPNTGQSSGKVQFSKMDYDTVTGETHGSQVFMTYDNDKAYPAYLIKYR